MRKLITIRKIDEVLPHTNADALELVRIDGWKCVVKKGEFKPGDECVYIEIDAFVPVDKEPFKFLETRAIEWKGHRGARIKTIKLRGEISQGLALPVSSFAEDDIKAIKMYMELDDNVPALNNEDADGLKEVGIDAQQLTELSSRLDNHSILGIYKWEPTLPGEGNGAKLGGATKGNWPYFLQKTDQERVQNFWNGFGYKGQTYRVTYTNELNGELITVDRPYKYIRDTDYEVTIKLDGSSMTAYYNDGQFGICSRNLEVKPDSDLAFAVAAQRLNLAERLKFFCKNIALQGELVGKGIQGNNENMPINEKYNDVEFFVFDIYDIDRRQYMDAEDRYLVLDQLNNMEHIFGPQPPILHVPVLEAKRHFDFKTIDEALAYADGPSLNPKSKREGVVFKCLSDPSFSFKIISNEYLLKNSERG